VERPLREALATGDGEVPGEVEALARDAGLVQLPEQLPEVGPPALDEPLLRLLRVSVEAEVPACLQGPSARVLQVAQRDDVALALGEVLGRADDEDPVPGRVGVRVDLGPDEVALAGARVDDDDRRALGKALDTSLIPGSLLFLAAAALSRPGTLVISIVPGLKPSALFMSVGSIGVPPSFLGIEERLSISLRPVGVDLSRFV
jgi:hypothetical protein